MILHKCDFCNGTATFTKVYDESGVFHWLEGVDGSHSDYLVILCGDCVAEYRNKN